MVSIEFLITSLIVVLIPGTGVVYTISVGIFRGFRTAVAASLGCTLGIVPSLVASVVGLSLILHTSAVVFQCIKFAGVAYLLYLAWMTWKDTGGMVLQDNSSQTGLINVALKGFLINILNPKLTIFFMAFLPQFVPSSTENGMLSMGLLGGIFMVMTFLVFVGYGALANLMRKYVIGSEVVAKYMQRTFAASFALLGLKLATTDEG
ncbi:LysE family translocator [Marinomonas mediterranea]|jgi:Putative threonine efflux protein|uniref:Lysine exporter protein (LYSE/YGGA) n=1 Tax=Marinomonas mediterranea (strain ATCC 700492 / JCM 21426 / NBRC 103028 / MMB-1) TaxID=717774 RepID=F2JXT0_MARM1|nr:LysE family translocator [Marinomonas mediterranea]ADZ93078.1 Lysine exporter protein (LYSE/YGGA) [Marinomonas mediterranea MMB-1]WCN10984.1 LysE family transporter [Marinomonas mediterranea]WCN15046.1 LysE family transporter [Marinomonas mediterranea]WCN19090.1 LysE family transporter [Marinomonas mediterranea MMB-1]